MLYSTGRGPWWLVFALCAGLLGACNSDDGADPVSEPNQALLEALVADTGTVWLPQYVVYIRIDSTDDDTLFQTRLLNGNPDTLFPYSQQRFTANGQATFSSRTAKNSPWKIKTWSWTMHDDRIRIADDSTAAADYQRILECTPDTLRAEVVRYTTQYLYKRYTVVYSAAQP
jgi:hypothetical protein